MQNAVTCRVGNIEPKRFLDAWLRFDPSVEASHEEEFGKLRSEDLRDIMHLGLVLFNIHNLTNIFLISDIVWFAVALRTLVITPITLVLIAYLPRMSPQTREITVLSIVSGAFLVEVALFWLTSAQLGPYTFSEFSLTLVFGNMLLALRYRHAVVFTILVFGLALLAVIGKPVLDHALRFAFIVQISMGCVMSLYANYRTERRRCADYLVAYLARIQAGTDPLTKLPNRRLMTQRLDAWFRDDLNTAIMMIDVDFFKLFNDTFGHQAGDDCLRQIGSVLAEAAEDPNIFCARFGGEEFTLAVRDAEPRNVECIAVGIVTAIEALGVPHVARTDGVGIVTASVGVALRSASDWRNQAQLFAAADHALYKAKHSGRNRVVFDNEKMSRPLDSDTPRMTPRGHDRG